MRKLLIVFSLSLMLILPACKPLGLNSCPFTRTHTFVPLTPGATYQIIYNFTNPLIILTRVANSNGSISVPSHGLPCNSLTVIAVTNSNLALAASPSSVNLASPPTTATVTGQSFDTTYSMPRVEYFDGNGYLVGSVYATSVSGDGTSLEAKVPNLSSGYSGTYQVRITNMTYQGYYAHTVGYATITAWGRDRPDSDGDGWYDDEDCDPYDPYFNYSCVTTCGGYDNLFLEICPY